MTSQGPFEPELLQNTGVVVLVFPRIELLFLIVASMGLCFRFVLRAAWRIQGCFSVAE